MTALPPATTGVDVALLVFSGLNHDEQDEALGRMQHARALRDAAGESQKARCLRSLQAVAERLGGVPGVEDYKRVSRDLISEGEDVETFARLYKHFENNWARAREVLELADTTTEKRIDAFFRNRRVAKVWRFSEPALREAVTQASERYGRPPSVAEFESWREHQMELAQARGEYGFHLPSSSPFRRRYGTWEKALLHFGYTPAEVELRLDNRGEFKPFDPDANLPADLPVCELAHLHVAGLPLENEQVKRLRAAWAELPRRSRYILTSRLGLGVKPLTLKETGQPLGSSDSHISRLHLVTLAALAANAAGDRRDRPEPETLHEPVVETLRALARIPPAT